MQGKYVTYINQIQVKTKTRDRSSVSKEGVTIPAMNHGASIPVSFTALSICVCTDIVNDADECAVKNDEGICSKIITCDLLNQ